MVKELCDNLVYFLGLAVAWYVQVVHGQCPEGHIELWTVSNDQKGKDKNKN